MAARPSPIATARTEVACAAEAVAALLVDGVLRHDPLVIAAAARSIGVSVPELRDAWRRVSDTGYRTPKRVAATAAPSHTAREPMRSPRRPWLEEATEQKCTKCYRTLPIDQFPWVSGQRRGRQCHDCRRAYRQKRYLSVEMQTELGHVLRFVAGEDDACIGQECPSCSKAIEEGQNVVVRSRSFEHARCLTDAGLLEHRDGDVGRKTSAKRKNGKGSDHAG